MRPRLALGVKEFRGSSGSTRNFSKGLATEKRNFACDGMFRVEGCAVVCFLRVKCVSTRVTVPGNHPSARFARMRGSASAGVIGDAKCGSRPKPTASASRRDPSLTVFAQDADPRRIGVFSTTYITDRPYQEGWRILYWSEVQVKYRAFARFLDCALAWRWRGTRGILLGLVRRGSSSNLGLISEFARTREGL
jgi:hypothetical protein